MTNPPPATRNPNDGWLVSHLVGRTITEVRLDWSCDKLELVLSDGSTLTIADPTADQGLVIYRT
jgi:hypothetical protein